MLDGLCAQSLLQTRVRPRIGAGESRGGGGGGQCGGAMGVSEAAVRLWERGIWARQRGGQRGRGGDGARAADAAGGQMYLDRSELLVCVQMVLPRHQFDGERVRGRGEEDANPAKRRIEPAGLREYFTFSDA